LGDPARLAEALYLYGIALMYTGDDRAVPVAAEFLAIARRLADQRWLGIALWALGRAQYAQGHHEQAAELLEEALVQVQTVGSPLAAAFVHWTLGELAWDLGAEARALPLLRQAMARLWDLKETWSALACLERLAVTFVRGRPLIAARLLAAAAVWRDTVGLRRPAVDEARYERALGAVREALGGEAFVAAWADGQSLSPEQAIAEALEPPLA
jgi:tetratricopeptide (TPR) repeat protein